METFKAKPSLSAAKQLATVAAGKASRVRTARSQQSSGPHAHSDLLDLLDRNGMALETGILSLAPVCQRHEAERVAALLSKPKSAAGKKGFQAPLADRQKLASGAKPLF